MRKRNIIFALLGLELLALPAAAYVFSDKVNILPSHVVAAEIDSPPGIMRFFVTSDGPFKVTGKDLTGDVQVFVFEHGQIGDVTFGGHSQLPGPAKTCRHFENTSEHLVYDGQKHILTAEADAISQAVLFTFVFDSDITPEISFKSSISPDIKNGSACS